MSEFIAASPHLLEDGLRPYPSAAARELVFADGSRLGVLLLDRDNMIVIVECKQGAPRKEPNFSYRLLRAIYPAFRVLFPNQVIRADDLARAIVDVAVRGTAESRGLVFENRDICAMVESLHTPKR